MTDLPTLRQQIDECDAELIAVLARRMQLVKQVGEYKKHHQLPPLDETRWQQVQQKQQTKAAKLGLATTFTRDVFELIHTYALTLEAGND